MGAGLLDGLRASARPLEDANDIDEALLARLAASEIVLLGEASHGTHEFYRFRAQLTKRLLEAHGFAAVAVEADWPDALRVDDYVRGVSEDSGAVEALADFQRFPTWMWRNSDVVDLVGWMRDFNEGRSDGEKARFVGMDLYSLFRSTRAVLEYLEDHHPELGAQARALYACFDHHREDPQAYGYAASYGLGSCENAVVEVLRGLVARQPSRPDDAFFSALMNARVAQNAEAYYRTMFRGRVSSWNLRDKHMAQTLFDLRGHLAAASKGGGRLVVWAHNSHLGDARATEMGRQGEWNVGQLVRERFGERAFLLGFTSYEGTVTAAHDWDQPPQRKRMRPGMHGSYEKLFHEVGVPKFWLDLRNLGEAAAGLREERLERAIGVVYRPESERMSHYFDANLAAQFDAVVHFDRTRAVEPLERGDAWRDAEPPETYPTGI